jgi:hypothetical protein
MAIDRFTRFKRLRDLWARARTVMAWLVGPHEREARVRATRWQQIQVAERQIRDGLVRGTGDPDSALRPPGDERDRAAAATVFAAWEAQRQQWEAQRQALEAQQRQQRRR